jgi:nucleotide-binding universal stress UspA family protein
MHARSRGNARNAGLPRGTTFARPPTMNRTVILTAVDANPSAVTVVAAAARIAALPGAELHIVHVVEAPDVNHLTAQLEQARTVVEKACGALSPDVVPTVHIAGGDPAKQILQVAANLHADMIVIGTRELSKVERLLLGSVVEHVARRAQCAVFVVRETDYHTRALRDIDPPCPECLAKQRESNGAELWCSRHSQRHVKAHLHYELPEGFGAGSSLIMPQQT